MSLTLWRYYIPLENIRKHAITKYVTYTRHYAQATEEETQQTKTHRLALHK